MLSDFFNYSRLLPTLCVDIVVRVEDTNLLIPEYQCVDPVTAEPARFDVQFFVKTPLGTTGHAS